ncbi:MAG: heavy metal response regulator transcription factor [Aquabacterium sp.]|nr:heavy metal response regulator transcription factor [Aquabacterium sp.]
MKLLLVEDDVRTQAYLTQGLSEQGYVVDVAPDGVQGLHLARTGAYDAVVLDGMLPGLDGLQLLRLIRQTPGPNQQAPVIMLTARDTVDDRVRGLQHGADDYLVKPFSFMELLARLQALLRRAAPRAPGSAAADVQTMRLCDLELDLLSRQARRAGQRINLTAKEFALLSTLLRRQGQVLSKTVLAELVWDIHFDSDLNVVEAAIKRLRAKIDDGQPQRLLHTVRGMGYVLEQRAAERAG